MRVAIVGTGSVAQRHLGVLEHLPDLDLVGHLSTDAQRAEAQANRWGGRPYVNFEHLLNRERPEAVWLCLIPDQHGPPELALIEHGVPFFIEKPLAVDLQPAEDIARLVDQARLVVGVGYKLRALDTLPRVRALLEETPPRMALGAWHDAMPLPLWWRQSKRSGGQIVEQATHLVDLARQLLGEAELVSAVVARWSRADAPDSDVPDVSSAHLRFGDVPAVFSATCLLQGRQAIHLQLICAGRVITITEQQVLIETGRDTQSIATTVDPFQVEDIAFLEAVRARDPSRVLSSYADAFESHRLCCAIRDFGSR